MMVPIKSLIHFNRDEKTPVYLQIVNSFIIQIKNGNLKPDLKLPGTRLLAEELNIHRKTAVSVYDELHAQGWITIVPFKGSFISSLLPEIRPSVIKDNTPNSYPLNAPYLEKLVPENKSKKNRVEYKLDDGLPDVRLAPVKQLTQKYMEVARRPLYNYLGYGSNTGDSLLRKNISDHLNTTRCLKSKPENILISRGSQMAIYLVANLILKRNDNIIVGDPGYPLADTVFENTGANIIRVPTDDEGLRIENVEKILSRKKIRAIYVTPHHHYPTTVTLSAQRRIHLIRLAEKYGFAIIEDDYDYEFHYKRTPILPLSNIDDNGHVIYIGSVSKSLAPALRIGFVVAPINVIEKIAKLRSTIDISGDPILERAIAELFQEGIIASSLKRNLKIYETRRNHFSALLKEHLSKEIQFIIPQGGLAIWAQLDKKISLEKLSLIAEKKRLHIENGLNTNTNSTAQNAVRLGFASNSEKEMLGAFQILEGVFKKEFKI